MTELIAFGEQPLSYVETGGTVVDAEFDTFLRDGHQPLRWLLDVNSAELDTQLDASIEVAAFSELTASDPPGGSVVIGQRLFFFSDGLWVGRPNDPARPNTTADARIKQVADIERTIPLYPEAERRSESTVGEFVLANPDGALDEMSSRYSISGRVVRLYVGRTTDPFTSFRQMAQLFGQDTEGDLNEMRVRVQPVETYLTVPLQISRYDGEGGTGGDAGIAGRLKPVCLGKCFNVTPVLINQAEWIYQVNSGPIYRVDKLKERGLELDYSGTDVSGYAELASLNVAAGEWASCNSLGLIKAGLGAGGPAGPITADVLGDASVSGYVAELGAVLLRVLLTRARLPGAYIDIASFDALSLGPVGYYADGTDETTVADVMDHLLRGVNGFYGTRRDRLLHVARLRAPENHAAVTELSENIIRIEEIEMNPPARYEQTVAYKKNWTVMSDTDVSIALDSDERQVLQLPGQITKRVSSEARIRHLAAISGETIDTFMADEAEAATICSDILSLHRATRRLFRVEIDRTGMQRQIDIDQVVSLAVTKDRFKLAAGQKFLVVGMRIDGRRETVELTIWG